MNIKKSEHAAQRMAEWNLSPATRGGKTCTRDLQKKRLKSPNTMRT